jgi:hypothetical protein
VIASIFADGVADAMAEVGCAASSF